VYVDILPKCHQKIIHKGPLTMSAQLFTVTVKDRTSKHSFSPCWQIPYNHKTEGFIWPQMWTRLKKFIKINRNSFLQNQCIICIYIYILHLHKLHIYEIYVSIMSETDTLHPPVQIYRGRSAQSSCKDSLACEEWGHKCHPRRGWTPHVKNHNGEFSQGSHWF
jgi:hypothetical protein